ncbi:MAG: ABC transporter permease [Eubacteriales bacterium]|nr:ABC transporter permease [Eubacteriales bacterium]
MIKEKFKLILKNKMLLVGFILFLCMIVVVIFAPQIAPHTFAEQNSAMRLASPSFEYPFGTDQYGRCIFSRVVYGSRIALCVGIVAVIIETLIGVTLGIISGYYGKTIDKIVLFITDTTWSIPPIILAMAIVLMLGSSAQNVAIAVAVVSWAQFTKIIRAKVQSLKNLSYIEAAKIYGESDFNIIIRYILPNLVSTIVILATLALPSAILSTTSMGFLGLGAQQPQPDWGMILSEGIQFIRNAPWISMAPGIAIVWTVLGFNLVGEGVKELLDPRLKV